MNSTQDHSEANLAALTPVLDEAINQLGEADRTAIVLRFYEQRDLRSVGEALGSSENAAQKRVARALDALRLLLQRRGVALSVTALASMLAAEAVSAAPSGMAGVVSTAVLAGSAKTGGGSATILKIMAASKVKMAVVGAILATGVIAPFVVQERSGRGLREQEEALSKQDAEIAQLEAENQRLSATLSNRTPRLAADPQFGEVLKLRGEVSALQRDMAEMKTKTDRLASGAATPLSPEEKLALLKSKYAEQVSRLKDWLTSHPSERIPELDGISDHDWIDAVDYTLGRDDDFERAMSSVRRAAESRIFQGLRVALRDYAVSNGGGAPTEISQLKPYFKDPIEDMILQRYQIVPSSRLVPELQAGEIVITQVSPVNPNFDSRVACGLTSEGQIQQLYADERVTNRWNFIH